MEDWEYSSFKDYSELRNGELCNKEMAKKFIDFDEENFVKESYRTINPDLIEDLFSD